MTNRVWFENFPILSKATRLLLFWILERNCTWLHGTSAENMSMNVSLIPFFLHLKNAYTWQTDAEFPEIRWNYWITGTFKMNQEFLHSTAILVRMSKIWQWTSQHEKLSGSNSWFTLKNHCKSIASLPLLAINEQLTATSKLRKGSKKETVTSWLLAHLTYILPDKS